MKYYLIGYVFTTEYNGTAFGSITIISDYYLSMSELQHKVINRNKGKDGIKENTLPVITSVCELSEDCYFELKAQG